jgi:DNA (cytosine-5)-methyltransferase 1
VDNTKELPTLLSFCTGYGGIERGIESVVGPVRTLAHVEIEAYAIANLVDKMESGEMVPAPVWTNVKTFPAKLFRGCVDILTAGYPCQPFSAAGKRQGKDDPRHLWPFIRKHVQTIKPAICFFENVEGHISLGLSTVISDLEEDGYTATWGIFSASEVGAPHQRKRVYIMAYRDGCRGWKDILPAKLRADRTKQPPCNSGEDNEVERQKVLWPASPGQEQYEWEEPRVI